MAALVRVTTYNVATAEVEPFHVPAWNATGHPSESGWLCLPCRALTLSPQVSKGWHSFSLAQTASFGREFTVPTSQARA